MLPRMNMFGEGAEGPMTGRIATGFDSTPVFNAQVIPMEVLPVPPLERPDPVGGLLGSPKPAKVADALGTVTKLLMDVPASPVRDALMREWFDLSPRIEAFLAEIKAQHMAGLRRQIAELTPLCRASLDRLRALRSERGGLEGQGHALEERRGETSLKLRTAIGNKPDDETFPTDAELAAWSRTVDRARAADTRVAEQQAELRELLAQKDEEARVESAQLTELKKRRENCRAELEGRPRKGPFGLQIPGA